MQIRYDEAESRLHVIRSKRLLLKRMVVEDVTEPYVTWLNDFETIKYLEVRFTPQTRKNVEDYVRQHQPDNSSTLHFGIFDREGTRLVGTTTFNHMDIHHLSASISFVIGHQDAIGKGYATEAVHAATHYMFTTKRFVKLWGGYYADHIDSEKVFMKNGYIIEGRLKEKLVNYRGERVDHIYVGLLYNDFIPNKELLGLV